MTMNVGPFNTNYPQPKYIIPRVLSSTKPRPLRKVTDKYGMPQTSSTAKGLGNETYNKNYPKAEPNTTRKAIIGTPWTTAHADKMMRQFKGVEVAELQTSELSLIDKLKKLIIMYPDNSNEFQDYVDEVNKIETFSRKYPLSNNQRDTLVKITRLVDELLKGVDNVSDVDISDDDDASDVDDVDASDADDDDADDNDADELKTLIAANAKLQKDNNNVQSVLDLNNQQTIAFAEKQAQLDRDRAELERSRASFQSILDLNDEMKVLEKKQESFEFTRGPYDMGRNPSNPTINDMSSEIGKISQASSIVSMPPSYVTLEPRQSYNLASLTSIKPNKNIITDEAKAAIIRDNTRRGLYKPHTINAKLLDYLGVKNGAFASPAGLSKQSKLNRILKSDNPQLQFAMKTLSRNTSSKQFMPFNMTPAKFEQFLLENGPGSDSAKN
jgi:hypothetical protein